MNTKKTSKGLIGAGLLSAIAASLCCITPVLALIAGSSGIASTFSWLEPARPYLIGITVLMIGFAWYQKLKPRTKEQIECDCETDEKPSFLQSKMFLGIVTVFAALMLAFPYYSHIFFPKTESKVIIIESNNIASANFEIAGMTCQGCEEEVKHEVSQLSGFISAEVNHETGKATVKFDKSKTTIEQVATAINATGYKVTKQEEVKN
ncbi:MAG: mercuric transport protein MerTP [Bacteroidetes bacterium]|nr:mercuric transport protein MerTP [Bacteroidota bacterium]